MDEPGHQEQTRAAYDQVAADYATLLRDHLAGSPVDRAVLGLFAELVRADGGGPVADLGCGPGRITAPLHDLGLDVVGIDLSPGMVAVARAEHPHLRFSVGSLAALDLDDGALAGAVCWYSLIHTPPAEQPAVLTEVARVLRPGGHVLLAFQVGVDERVRLEQAYGHDDLAYDVYRLDPDRVAADAAAVGLEVTTRLVREPVAPEPQRQAHLLARRRPVPD